MPTWLGDCVMATPALAALRKACPESEFIAVFRPAMAGLAESMPWINRAVTLHDTVAGLRNACRAVGKPRIDLAVLLPNSFRSAVLPAILRAKRRLGYARDGRGWLLTDRLDPPRTDHGQYQPTPAVDYYLDLLRSIGVDADAPQLALRPPETAQATASTILQRAGLDPSSDRQLVVLNPGAQRLDKRWPPERFAAVADTLAESHGTITAVNGAPREAEVLQAVVTSARTPVVDLSKAGMTLDALPAVLGRAALLVTNDTGTRHVAAAMGVPVVSIFGPTTLDWTRIPFDAERALCAVDASTPGPITQISIEQVVNAARSLLADRNPAHGVSA